MQAIGTKINIEQLKENRVMNCKEILTYFQMHKTAFWCWGAHAFTNVNNFALRMKVSGLLFKGHVYVCNNAMDLMDVYFTTTQGTIQDVLEGVYIEDLFTLMDAKIEHK